MIDDPIESGCIKYGEGCEYEKAGSAVDMQFAFSYACV
jgi:hypothetical protein